MHARSQHASVDKYGTPLFHTLSDSQLNMMPILILSEDNADPRNQYLLQPIIEIEYEAFHRG